MPPSSRPPKRPASGSRTTSRQLLSRAERSASILDAAAHAFAQGGFAATSMDDVAAAAGVTRLIVYRHFDSKEDLYRAVLDQVAGRLGEELATQMEQDGPERFGFTTRTILTVARENADAVRLLFVHAQREGPFASYAGELWEGAVAVARTLIADRLTDPVVKDWAAQASVRYLINGVLVWLDVGTPERDEEFVVMATNGLRAMFLAWIDPAALDAVLDQDHPA